MFVDALSPHVTSTDLTPDPEAVAVLNEEDLGVRFGGVLFDSGTVDVDTLARLGSGFVVNRRDLSTINGRDSSSSKIFRCRAISSFVTGGRSWSDILINDLSYFSPLCIFAILSILSSISLWDWIAKRRALFSGFVVVPGGRPTLKAFGGGFNRPIMDRAYLRA